MSSQLDPTNPKTHPDGGWTFDAICLPPEGWQVLAPWVRTPEGYWWRPILRAPGWGHDARAWAEHLARELNEAARRSVQ